MKKHTVTLFALAALAAAGCTKEEWPERPTTVMQETVSTTLYYSIDGEMYEANLSGKQEQSLFFDQMLALARQGHRIRISRHDLSTAHEYAKETVTFTTTDGAEAKQWAEDMFNNGYEVIINYDSDHGIYTCIATR